MAKLSYQELEQKVKDLESELSLINDANDIKLLEFKLKNKDKQIQEQQLQIYEIENRLRLISNNTRNFVYRYSLTDNKFHFVTQSIYNILGYRSEEFIANFDKLKGDILAENKEYFENKLYDLNNVLNNDSFTIQLSHRFGDLVWMDIDWHIVYDKNRNPHAIEGIAVDITNIKQKELELRKKNIDYILLNSDYAQVNEKLRHSNVELRTKNAELIQEELRFRSLFQNMGHCVVIFDFIENENKFIFKDLNVSAEKLENIQRQQIVGKELANNLPVLNEQRLLETFNNVINTEKSKRILLTKNNEENKIISWIECFIYKLPLGEIVVIYEDVTYRKKAERDLINTKDRYRIATEETKVSVWERTLETGRTYVDSVLLKMLGYETLKDKDESFEIWKSYLSKEDEAKLESSFNKLFSGELELLELELHSTHKDESLKWFLIKGVALKDKTGKVFKLIGTISDITKQKQFEKQLILAKERAEESDKLKSSFLANMSHEIRTPMNGILGFADLLKTEDLDKEEHNKFTDIIISNGRKLLDIIRDILDIAKIESGQFRIVKDNCCVNSIMDSLYLQYQASTSHNQNLAIKQYKDLSDSESVIITDCVRFEQIASYLLSNAVKFTEKGYVEFGYYLVENNNQKKLQFFVKDTGIGIPDDKKYIIFDAFRQLDDSHTRLYGGTGLGLTIAKGLVNLLGGKIWFESQFGLGSTFYFNVPFVEGNKTIVPANSNSDKLIFDWKNKTILVVEDDESSYEYLFYILNQANANVERVFSGYDAIEKCKNNDKIDLVLMDIQLLDLSGYKATKEIRKRKPNLPIIAQTASALTQDKNKSIKAGCNDYVSKPIKRDILMNKIALFFNNR